MLYIIENLLTISDDKFEFFSAMLVARAFHKHTATLSGIIVNANLSTAMWAYNPLSA